MTIRCHFDGKVFVPDEEVDIPVRRLAEARVGQASFTGGAGGTIGDLLNVAETDVTRSEMTNISGGDELAGELRRRASQPNLDKQRAMIDLHGFWDEQHRRGASR